MRDIKIRVQLHDVLFFLLLVFSIYFTRNIVCSLLMVLFFGYTIVRQIIKRKRMKVPFFCIGFLVFILYGALNIYLDNVLSADVSKTMVISLLLNFMMIYAIIQYVVMQNNIPRILRITEFGILTVTLLIILFSLGNITQGRLATGTEMNANALSMLCVYGFALTMYFHKIQAITSVSYWIRVAIYLISILLTGSRKGLIMIVLVIVVVNLAGGTRKIIRGILIGAVAAIALYVAIMNVDFLYNIIGQRVESLIILLTEGSTTEGSLNSRQALIDIGMGYIKEKPWTGYGFDCFKLISGTGGGGKVGTSSFGYYSHNNYIELLFGGGIIGLVLYYIPILYLFIRLLKNMKKNRCVAYLLAILVSKLAVEYAYVSYYDRVDAYLLAVIMGCVLICQGSLANNDVANS